MRVVGKGAGVLLRLMGSVLSVSGVRTNALRFVCASISIGRVVHRLRNVFELHLRRTSIPMHVVFRPGLPIYFVRARGGHVSRIVSGFLSGTFGCAIRNDVAVKCRVHRGNVYFCISSANANVPRSGMDRIFRHFAGLSTGHRNAKLKLSVDQAVVGGVNNRVNIASGCNRNSAF